MDLHILHIWKREWIPSASKLFTYLFYMWRKYDITDMLVTLMSCENVCCMCADWWRSWLMARFRACVRANGGHFEHTLWLSVYFLCTWWTLCFTPHLMQWVIYPLR